MPTIFCMSSTKLCDRHGSEVNAETLRRRDPEGAMSIARKAVVFGVEGDGMKSEK
jgi:hypothetical protein